MSLFQNLVQWLVQNPLGAASLLYITGVMSTLVYAYLETPDSW